MSEPMQESKPASVADAIDVMSSLSIKLSLVSEPSPQRARIPLLQPLGHPSVLAVCQNSGSKVDTLNTNGQKSGPSVVGYLNIAPLGLAWRQLVAKGPPLSEITFDLTMPKDDHGSNAFQKGFWDYKQPNEDGVAVDIRQVLTLIRTLATAMRMRVKGDLHFEVICLDEDETQRPPASAMASLRKQLLELEKSNSMNSV